MGRLDDIDLTGIGQDIYYAITPTVQYVVGGVSYLINFIPLIDVLLVMLIFLMVTTTYSRFSELQIELPSAEANKTQNRTQDIQVGVTADESRRFNGRLDELVLDGGFTAGP